MMDIWEYKAAAHELIDDCVALGMSRGNVYKRLRQRLGTRPGEEHIGSMSAVSQVQMAISALRKMREAMERFERRRARRRAAADRDRARDDREFDDILRRLNGPMGKKARRRMYKRCPPGLAELQRSIGEMNRELVEAQSPPNLIS